LTKHNSALGVKIELRQRCLSALNASPVLFESHGGFGMLRKAIFQDVEHLSCDMDKSTPDNVHADSLLVMRAVDLSAYNFFDIDPYGDPWHHVWLVSHRRAIKRGERIALCVTSGTQGRAHAYNMVGITPTKQILDAGISQNCIGKFTVMGFAESYSRRLLSSWFRAGLVYFASAFNKEKTAFYFGCVFEGIQDA
jgi:hypothetical protein